MIRKLNKNKQEGASLKVVFVLVAGLLSQLPVAEADIVADLMDDFARLEKNSRATGQGWFDLAIKAREAGKLDVAGQALDRAAGTNFSPVRIGLERSRQLIVGGDADAAVAELNSLLDQGFTSVNVVQQDPVIGALAGNPAYDALIEQMSRQAYPCEYRDAFRDFDFWLGEWDVHLANGAVAGSNSITREQHGCVLVEHWTSVTGGTGMSINYLDLSTGEWVQLWNDAGGGQINIRGGLGDDGMALVGTIHNAANGTSAPFRGLWTPLPDGRVRQYFEQSNDDGETWVPWFEGFYTRKSK